MHGWSRRDAATLPESGPSLDGREFTTQVAAAFAIIADRVAVAFDIGVDAQRRFVDARSSEPIPAIVDAYSHMKHGDLRAVGFFGRALASAAVLSARFLAFNREAVASERVVYITTAAVFNVPSASNLLLRATAGQLNVTLSREGLAPVIVVEQTRLSESPLGYPSTSVRERRNEFAAGRGVTIVPEQFHGQNVIFLDDLFNTGYTINRAAARLRNVGVADSFYLFAARIDPHVVGATEGAIEDDLNDATITGTLASVAPILQSDHFAVVQKLLGVVLNPAHTAALSAFVQQIPTSSLEMLYVAASSDGYRHRREGSFLPSLLILEAALEERGGLDAPGRLGGALWSPFGIP